MLSFALVLTVGAGYVALLFVIAFVTDGLAGAGRAKALGSPVVYTLSLAVYCTSWTFYGAVGTAVRSGLEFVTIYIGPTLVLMAWWLFLRKLVVITKAQNITSIADFLSARYGKSRTVACLVTVIAIASITPYIALQLIAVSRSFAALVGEAASQADTAFWTAALMAFFVIAFGTRRLNADESQPGIVAAIAFESIVKLAALLAIALFAILTVKAEADPPWREALASVGALREDGGTRWVVLTMLSAAAIVCLPRQFQVAVVENRDPRHLDVAAWLFPLYLFLITLAVLPIAVAGLTLLPAGSEPDLFVLTVPLAKGAETLALVAFIGGLSAATSMVIVATLALAVMISQHIVAPVLADATRTSPMGLAGAVILTRRLAIVGVLALGYLYARASGGGQGLASIGLIAFAGVAQFAPALICSVFWRDATRQGAACGLAVGGLIWFATLLLPSFGVGTASAEAFRTLILPSAGGEVDPLVFGATLSLIANAATLAFVSLIGPRRAIDELQATLFVDALHRGGPEPMLRRSASRRDLYRLTQRIVGPVRTHALFAEANLSPDDNPADSAFVARIEREIAYAVGAASAHALVARIATGEPISVDAAIAILGETQEAVRAARALGVRSVELERSADELRAANAALTALLAEKDAFLSRVSHEMRTPLTAIRAFAELLAEGSLSEERAARFVGVIASEAERLTRLLDDILDLSRLEAGRAPLTLDAVDASALAHAAARAMEGFAQSLDAAIAVDAERPVIVRADADRVMQVLVNLLSNAVKFHGADPIIRVSVREERGEAVLRVSDGGEGVAQSVRANLFTKFAGGATRGGHSGAGLGLAISHEIMVRLGGRLVLEATGPNGSVFTVAMPLARALEPA